MEPDATFTKPPWHEREETASAPGDLELIRGFLSLHEHLPDRPDPLPPSPTTVEWWLRDTGLLPADEPAPTEDLAWAGAVLEALRTRVLENTGSRPDARAVERLNAAASEAGLRPRFGAPEHLVASTHGVRGAVGRILAVCLVAEVEGTWRHLKACANPECRSLFYDRSRNHSGRWCAMQSCGNRMKVRAWRERQRAG